MADNVVVTPGSGKTIAADEVSDGTLGTCSVQYVKIMDGTLDGTNKATVGSNGLYVEQHGGPSTRKDQSAVAIGSIATVWTPTSGKKFRLLGGTISVSAAANVLFEDNSGGNFIFRTPKLLVDTPYYFDLGPDGYLSSAANNVLKATSSASANLTGTIWGIEV